MILVKEVTRTLENNSDRTIEVFFSVMEDFARRTVNCTTLLVWPVRAESGEREAAIE